MPKSNDSKFLKFIVCHPIWAFLIASVIIVILTGIYGRVVYLNFCKWGDRGTFGDMFGALNAVFSGLAFVGVVIALLYQHAELTRVEETQDEDRQQAAKAIHAQSMMLVTQILQAENVRQARQHVFRVLKGKVFDDWASDTEDTDQAEIVCHTFDSVAAMCRCDLLPWDFVTKNRSHSICGSWNILEPLVKKYRTERESPELWSDFERLAKEARKSN